jgi:hypothetical protein
MMSYPDISNRFDVDDIRKLREYNSLRHFKIPHKEILDDMARVQNPLLQNSVIL